MLHRTRARPVLVGAAACCSLISFVRPLLQLLRSTVRVNSFVAGLKRVATNSQRNPPFIAASRLQGARQPHMLDFVAAAIHG